MNRDAYFQQLNKLTKVCTAWKDFILGSKNLTRDIKYFWLTVSNTLDSNNSEETLEKGLDFVQSGFISIVGGIVLEDSLERCNKIDNMGFVRDHIKNKLTVLTTLVIDVNDFTNIEAWFEILASSPEATKFDIIFQQSKLDVQATAERYWKVLLAVFFCNTKDKTLTMYDACDHDHCWGQGRQPTVADWSFTKNEYKRYKKVKDPGIIKEFELPDLCPQDNSFIFYSAPFWKSILESEVSIDRIKIWSHKSISFVDFDITQFTNFPFKCVRLQFNSNNPRLMLPIGPRTYFANCEKLEIYIAHINTEDKTTNLNLLKRIKHPNLHVVLGCPIRVSDADPGQDEEEITDNSWYGEEFWTLFDAENFVNRIAALSIKSLTYTLLKYNRKKSPTVTFNCDENFPFLFMEFLKTQRIYLGYKRCFVGDEDFFTLESAKASFPN